MFRRLQDVPPRQRLIQFANAVATPIVAGPMRLTHLVEFPKCGGSWIRNMICDYIGVEHYLADRLIRRHDVIQVHRLHRASYRRPIVVVRDPRDLYTSFYYHETRYEKREQYRPVEKTYTHDPDRPVREDFAAYLAAKIAVPRRERPPFSYTDFVQSWVRRPRACVVRYEDVLADANAELIRVAAFLGHPIDIDRITAVTEKNSFASETKSRYGAARKPGEADPTKFQRKGIAGDWKNHFNRESCELLQRWEGWTLRALGYEPDRGWIERFLQDSAADDSTSSAIGA